MSQTARERRLHPRKSFRTKVVFEDEFGDGLFYVWSQDFSEGGIFLASAIPIRIGTLLYLSFSLPGHRRAIRVTGEVVRLAGADGVGIRFVGLSDLARKRLEDFLS